VILAHAFGSIGPPRSTRGTRRGRNVRIASPTRYVVTTMPYSKYSANKSYLSVCYRRPDFPLLFYVLTFVRIGGFRFLKYIVPMAKNKLFIGLVNLVERLGLHETAQ
jgi:hypothetical protein